MPDPELERRAIALFQRLLDVPEAERDAWLDTRVSGDEALRARVDALQSGDRLAKLRTGGAAGELDDERPPERIGAYRLGELIGRGGMGSVYRGERATGDFDHVAAIKLIKPGLLSEALVERFQRERQTLASLSHPHIARLYDGGETEAGSPFIVMEHVEGLPLLSWVDRHRPTLDQRRKLFCDICGAVAFAHRNLVVHRDITPSNVLVTEDGTAKLIDFGISRPPHLDGKGDASSSGGSLGSLSLTPGYAAPERMSSAEVTTAADLYSLGKLLEKLMAAEAGDPELTAIVARATADRPQDRYPTAEALAADVQAWGEGWPVAAVNGGRSYLARKFVSRHRAGVAAAAAVLALLVSALVVTLLANRRAEVARIEAEQRFDQTRTIAKTMLFDAYDEVSKVPGSTRARAMLARTGLSYLDALAADGTAPLDVRTETGLGYVRLAQVTGGGQGSQLGRFQDSNVLLGKGEKILRPLWAARPEDPAMRRAWATLLIEQAGANLHNNNQIALGRRQAIAAQRVLEGITRIDAEAAYRYASAIQAEGDSHTWDADYLKARPVLLRGEAFIASLPVAMQADPQVTEVRSAVQRLLGESHHKLKEVEAARAALDRAVALNRRLVAAAPDDPTYTRKLSQALWYRAVVHRSNYRDPLARESIEESVALARRLRERDSSDASGVKMVAIAGEVYAQTLADAGRYRQSYAVTDEVLAAHKRLVELAGDPVGALRSMAQALRTGGGNQYNGGDYTGACEKWRAALAVFADLERRGALTELDRKNSLREMQDYHRRSCEGGPPRAGMGKTL